MEKTSIEKPIIEERQEIKEKEPRISYHILYGFHAALKDFDKFEAAYKEADVYVPEEIGSSARVLNFLNKLSQGELTPQEVADRLWTRPGSFAFEQFRVIHNSKKPILFIDVPAGHELLKMDEQSDKLFNESTALFKKGDFKQSIKTMRNYVINEVDLESRREEIIKKNLKEKIKEFVKYYPQLKEKDEIKVLLTLGAAHTRIYHDLKREEREEQKEGQADFSISKQFARQPLIFYSIEEALRRCMFLKDRQPSDIILARGIIESFLFNYYVKYTRITDDGNKAVMVGRKISSQLNLKEIKKISKELAEYSNPTALTAVDVLKKRGIKIPESEEEMDEMLNSKFPPRADPSKVEKTKN